MEEILINASGFIFFTLEINSIHKKVSKNGLEKSTFIVL